MTGQKKVRISDGRNKSGALILYHAVSSYQLLEVMLHRQAVHADDRTVLLLPDFIVSKYPQYKKLEKLRLFDEVFLFPYMRIPHHNEQQILNDTVSSYQKTVPYEITEFKKIYVAGAHFYFSLYLIQKKIPFFMFEDAAGMLSRPEILYEALQVSYPLHASVGKKYRLFDGGHPLIQKVICLKKAQIIDVSAAVFYNFSVEEQLEHLPAHLRRKIIRFFLHSRIFSRAKIILLTQQFANLGIMKMQEQRRLYLRLKEELPPGKLLIKRHPDDTMDYRKLFPHAKIIRQVFPAELLPYVFWKKPQMIYTFDSTGCENLSRHFIIRKIKR